MSIYGLVDGLERGDATISHISLASFRAISLFHSVYDYELWIISIFIIRLILRPWILVRIEIHCFVALWIFVSVCQCGSSVRGWSASLILWFEQLLKYSLQFSIFIFLVSVVRGNIFNIQERKDLETNEIIIAKTKVLRDNMQETHETEMVKPHELNGKRKSLSTNVKPKISFHTHRHCPVYPGDGEFVFMGRLRFNEIMLACAPRLEEWANIVYKYNETNESPCILSSWSPQNNLFIRKKKQTWNMFWMCESLLNGTDSKTDSQESRIVTIMKKKNF